MTEREIKYMIDGEDEFARCLGVLEDMCGSGCVRLQTNYYYDTSRRELHKAGVTLRVRQNKGLLQGQIKRHDKGISAKSEESYFSVARLPSFIEFEGKKAKMLGSLTTQRHYFEWNGCEIDLDANHYLGNTDYELEIEYPAGGSGAATAIAAMLSESIKLTPSRGGKYSRFLNALKTCLKQAIQIGVKGDGPASGESGQSGESCFSCESFKPCESGELK